MNSTLPFGIPQEAWAQILSVLAQQPKITQVRLFGSRAKGNYRPASDIDLCLNAEGLTLSEKFALENAIDDLLLPWKVDLAIWHMIDQPALKEHIERVGVDLQPSL
jgi:predicted nucleotidyltransferase